MSEISASQMMPKMMPPTGAAPQALASDINSSKMKEPEAASEALSFGQGGEEAVRESLSFAESQQASVFEMDSAHCHPEGEAHGGDNQSDDNSGGQQGGSGGGTCYFERKDDKKSVADCDSDDKAISNSVDSDDLKQQSFRELVENGVRADLPLAMAGAAWITAAAMSPPTQALVGSSRRENASASSHALCAKSLAQPKRLQAYAKNYMANTTTAENRPLLSPRRLLILFFMLFMVCAFSYHYSTPIMRSRQAQGVLNSLALGRESAAMQMGKRFDELKQKIQRVKSHESKQQKAVSEETSATLKEHKAKSQQQQ